MPDPLQRAFYELECLRGNWSVRELKRQIASLLYERVGLSTDRKRLIGHTRATAHATLARHIVRDPYVFEFLGLNSAPRTPPGGARPPRGMDTRLFVSRYQLELPKRR